jgi:transaldolase
VDTKVDAAIEEAAARLPEGPARTELLGSRGQAAVANARLAWASSRRVFDSPRFATLSGRGARVQRPLWASTSTKNPAYRDTLYVDELIGPDTVNTMPPATLQAFNRHGRVERTLDRGLEHAHALFRRLPELGVPVGSLIDQLEEEGVRAFARSYDGLLETLEARRQALAGRGR